MDKAFSSDVYSSHFTCLKYIGLWHSNFSNKYLQRLYIAYKCIIYIYCVFTLVLAFIQLYCSRHDYKLISLNLSTTFFAFSILIKNMYFSYYSKDIDELRFGLFRDRLDRMEPEDETLKKNIETTFLILRRSFYFAGMLFLPLWLISSLLTFRGGQRELPFSPWLPVNLDNDNEFAAAFLYHSLTGIYVTIEGIHGELALFSLMMQIELQYRILTKDITNIGLFYDEEGTNHTKIKKKNFNKGLVEIEVKILLKKCVKRNVQLNKYLKLLEMYTNKPMLLQMGCSLVLMVVNGIEVLMSLSSTSMKWHYQIGYTSMIVSDIFFICLLANSLQKQRQELSSAVYALPWYDMDTNIQKDLILTILGMQIDKTLTAGKLFKLDFYTFLGMLKTVSSWLALCWQFMKINGD